MTSLPAQVLRRVHRTARLPGYVHHPAFDDPSAGTQFDPGPLLSRPADFADRYMPDEVTREHARRMHYAASRMHAVKTSAGLRKWQASYLRLRDRIVLGNRKLIYRAVRRRMAVSNLADDMIGECHIVLIQAVAAFNPWLGVRFSTYAYTCLVRALARQSQKIATDWLAWSASLDALPDGEPGGPYRPEPTVSGQIRLDELFRDDHPLLSAREKAIISRRFCLGEERCGHTLEEVGRAVGLSKERVRQVQAAALEKLRKALAEPAEGVG